MPNASQPSKLSAIFWLLLIFGSIAAISWFAWSTLTKEPEPPPSQKVEPANEDPNTFNIDEQLDMLNEQ